MQSFPSSRKGQLLEVLLSILRCFIREALASGFEIPVADFCFAMLPEISHDRLNPLEKWFEIV
jgi:hypothetical protein